MIGFEGRLQWRQHKPFKLRAKPPKRKKTIIQRWLRVMSQAGPNLAAHPKFAIRSFFVRRTRNEQGANSASCAAKNRANPVGREQDYLYSSPRW
jgi:hypothetical protein